MYQSPLCLSKVPSRAHFSPEHPEALSVRFVSISRTLDQPHSIPITLHNGTGENKAKTVDAAIAVFGDANTTHIPSASLEAVEELT